MGILRKALRQALQQHPHLESVAESPQNEGGGGATVVELRYEMTGTVRFDNPDLGTD